MTIAVPADIRVARADALEVRADAGVVRIREAARGDRRILAALAGGAEALSLAVVGRGARLSATVAGGTVEIEVPRGCPVRVAARGGSVVEIGRLSGPLEVTAEEEASATAAGALSIEAAAGGDARVTVEDTPAVAVLRAEGRAEVRLVRSDGPEVSAAVRGSARLALVSGRVSMLALAAQEEAAVDLLARVDACAIRRSGGASVRGAAPCLAR